MCVDRIVGKDVVVEDQASSAALFLENVGLVQVWSKFQSYTTSTMV